MDNNMLSAKRKPITEVSDTFEYWEDINNYDWEGARQAEALRLQKSREKHKTKPIPSPERLKSKTVHTIRKWTFDRVIEIDDGDYSYGRDFDSFYHLVQYGGKWNVLTPARDYASDIWFDKVTFKGDRHMNPPFRVQYKGKYNFIDGKGQLLSDIWFVKTEPYFEKGWVVVRMDNGSWYWMNEDGELFDDDGTPYNSQEVQAESKKNVVKITEAKLKSIITESVNRVLSETVNHFGQPIINLGGNPSLVTIMEYIRDNGGPIVGKWQFTFDNGKMLICIPLSQDDDILEYYLEEYPFELWHDILGMKRIQCNHGWICCINNRFYHLS